MKYDYYHLNNKYLLLRWLYLALQKGFDITQVLPSGTVEPLS
jgi:hypothetical protein